MNVILIYQTDAWHSYKSMELIAIATTKKKRDALVKQFLRNGMMSKPRRDEIEEAMKQIQEWGQTQGLAERHDLEIYTEEFETNQLL